MNYIIILVNTNGYRHSYYKTFWGRIRDSRYFLKDKCINPYKVDNQFKISSRLDSLNLTLI